MLNKMQNSLLYMRNMQNNTHYQMQKNLQKKYMANMKNMHCNTLATEVVPFYHD